MLLFILIDVRGFNTKDKNRFGSLLHKNCLISFMKHEPKKSYVTPLYIR